MQVGKFYLDAWHGGRQIDLLPGLSFYLAERESGPGTYWILRLEFLIFRCSLEYSSTQIPGANL